MKSSAGVVQWFSATTGLGFIQPNAIGEDVFVHLSAVKRAGLCRLGKGQIVLLEIERDGRSETAAATNLRMKH